MPLSGHVYLDEFTNHVDINAALTDDGLDISFQLGENDVTRMHVQLAAVDSAQAGEVTLDAISTSDGVEVTNIQRDSSEATDETSLSVLVKDPESGNDVASVTASSSASTGNSFSAHVYVPESGTEFVTITGSDRRGHCLPGAREGADRQ